MFGLLTWIRSTLRGEVPASELYARRGAGTAAYSLAEEAADAGGDDRGTRLFRACAWNAFALQTIAETLIDTDASDDPGTAGYVPASTLQFASDCVDCVPEWIRLARIVQSDPETRIRGLPAKLPKWHSSDTTRRSELHGLRAAYEALEARVQSDLKALAATSPEHSLVEARRLCAEMQSAAEYAEAISSGNAGAVDRGEARWRLLSALESAFLLGQILALPTLVEIERARDPNATEPTLTEKGSWLEICAGWPVIDADGLNLGLVQRVLGDRDTGEFEGIDVAASITSPTLRVPPASISMIEAGEVKLSVPAAELAP